MEAWIRIELDVRYRVGRPNAIVQRLMYGRKDVASCFVERPLLTP